MNNEDKELDELLKSWTYEPVSDPEIHQKVRDRIHSDYLNHTHNGNDGESFLDWIVSFISHPAYASVLLITVIGATWGLSSAFKAKLDTEQEQQFAITYRQMIDPASSAKEEIQKYDNFQTIAHHAKLSKEQLNQTLHFIEQKVDLDDSQVNVFQKLHEQYFGQSASLYSSLIALENEYREFERKRLSGEEINFFKVYHNLNSQKEIYRQALQEQQNFINEVFKILNSEQKGKYGELFLQKNLLPNPSAYFIYPNSEWQI